MSGLAKYFPNTSKFIRNDKSEHDIQSLSGKLVFFYFSASWCPPCRGFTPQLAEFYGKFKDSKNFEIIWISWDEEQDDYDGYFAKMPWLALPFPDRNGVELLVKEFSVESIPTLIGVNADSGEVVTTTARAKVVEDPEGTKFPWKN